MLNRLALRSINDKTLDYEIETVVNPLFDCHFFAINDKILDYEIET